METTRLCPECQAPLPADAPVGLCPRCLLQQGALRDSASAPTEPPRRAKTAPPTAPALAAVAARFPQFEVRKLIGVGGMGAVYEVRQPQLDRIVALKVMLPEVADDPKFAERFSREARALAKLNHPNIVAVYDFGQAGDWFYFVMEFVDGANLRQAMRAGRLTAAQALAIVPKLCDALQFAHDEGIMHRDIKPENILLDKKGRVKIADFGLAKLLGAEPDDPSITVTGVGMGTPRYMAPEQLENAKSVDHRADIYSLGVVFYEMLTGELPLGRFATPSEKVQIDVRLDEIVLRSLERDVARRYQQVSEVKTAVENVTSTPGAKAPATPPAASPVPPFPSTKKEGDCAVPTIESQPGAANVETPLRTFLRLLLWMVVIAGAVVFCWFEKVTYHDKPHPIQSELRMGAVQPWLVVTDRGYDSSGLALRGIKPDFATGSALAGLCALVAGAALFSTRRRGVPDVRSEVRRCAIGLFVVGAINAVMVIGFWLMWFPESSWKQHPVICSLVQAGFLFFAALTFLIFRGALQMLHHESLAGSRAAAIGSLLSLNFVSIPVGIWALVRLSRPEVQALFPKKPSDSPAPASPTVPPPSAPPAPLNHLNNFLGFFMTPQPGYARQVGIPMLIFTGVWLVVMLAVTFLVPEENQPVHLITMSAGLLGIPLGLLLLSLRWAVRRGKAVEPAGKSAAAATAPGPRTLLAACLVLLSLFGFAFGLSFQAKTAAAGAGPTKLITVGALDPLYVSESGPSGFSTNLNFFSWSFFAVVVSGIALGALWRISREDQGKVPRDPAWWRNWWKQVGVWGGLLLIVCTIRTVMHPEKVLQPTGDRSVASKFTKLFSSGPEFREDRSRIPATRTAGRTDYAYTFSAPANHRLYVWIEWWKGGERTIDRDCNTAYVARRGDRLERSLQVIFNDGNIAGPATKGQVRIDWLFDNGTGNSTSGRWRPNFFEGLATSVDLDRVKRWTPKVGETVNLLEIVGGKESIDGNPVTEDRLRAGRWEAAMILRARVEAVPESRKWEGTITSFNAWNDNEEPSPTLLRLGESFGAVLGPFTDARNLREQIASRIKNSAAERAKAEQMLKDAGITFAADGKPDDLLKKLESIPAKTPAAPKTGEASKKPAAAPLAPAQDLRFAIQQDRSQLPTTLTPGRQDYAFQFSGPADHTLNVWLEVWRDGKLEIVDRFDFLARPKVGAPLEAALRLTTMNGDVASVESKGKVRYDWNMRCGGPNGTGETSGAWRPNIFKELGSINSTWDYPPKGGWHPRPGETVTILAMVGYRLTSLSEFVPGWSEAELLKGWPNSAVLIRARFNPARAGELGDGPGLGGNVTDREYVTAKLAQFALGKQLAVDLRGHRSVTEAHAALVAAASTPEGRERAAQMVKEFNTGGMTYSTLLAPVIDPVRELKYKIDKASAEEIVSTLEKFITDLTHLPRGTAVTWHQPRPFEKGPNGPQLTADTIRKLKLPQRQAEEANKVMQKYAGEAHALERRHTKIAKNEKGHVLVTIEPFSDECLELARKMVAELGGIVPQDILPTIRPGALPEEIFRTAGECRHMIELWKEEGKYFLNHRQTDWVPAPGMWRGDQSWSSSGPKMEGTFYGDYRLYWTEE